MYNIFSFNESQYTVLKSPYMKVQLKTLSCGYYIEFPRAFNKHCQPKEHLSKPLHKIFVTKYCIFNDYEWFMKTWTDIFEKKKITKWIQVGSEKKESLDSNAVQIFLCLVK